MQVMAYSGSLLGHQELRSVHITPAATAGGRSLRCLPVCYGSKGGELSKRCPFTPARLRSILQRQTGQPASSTNGSSSTGQESLYSRLGGAPAVETVVHDFYQRLLADDRLNFFFDGFDIKRLKGHQVTFLTYAFGGPALYSGRSMAAAHERLIAEKGLNQQHFDLVAGHLVDALTAANVSQEDIASAASIAMSVKPEMFKNEAALRQQHAVAA